MGFLMAALKRCSKCKQEKPRGEFNKHAGRSDGLQSRCQGCGAADGRECYQNNREAYLEARRKRHYRRKYDISLADYDAQCDAQGGQCATCRSRDPMGSTPEAAFAVDHCHASGLNRGLLCMSCNRHLGLLEKRDHLWGPWLAYVINPPALPCLNKSTRGQETP
ncbi:MAG: hypothetical protein GEU78_07960 [Actinobacteria bacterium]|nr:hypothetical protein [Actinomycetota bacterium]